MYVTEEYAHVCGEQGLNWSYSLMVSKLNLKPMVKY